jgi:hypothetical protein
MRKLPIIGLLIGAVAAAWAFLRKKKASEPPDQQDTTP